jgi:hypothetical protein
MPHRLKVDALLSLSPRGSVSPQLVSRFQRFVSVQVSRLDANKHVLQQSADVKTSL